jgi:N-methylhydantoinase B
VVLDGIDPITPEVVYHRLKSIAEEMEIALLRSSFSTIVKEIRDCSTAIFDAKGQSIAQATSIPVHLGTLFDLLEPWNNTHAGAWFIPVQAGTRIHAFGRG